jgi:glycine/D-amino acid oxidase-like deaminating enzyme
MSEVVILGSGIIGLYTTYCLINEAGVAPNKITVIAKYLPGDQSTLYTSPWAGGNFSCISPNDAETLAYDKFTYTHLAEIQSKLGGPSCGLDLRPSTEYWDQYPGDEKINSLKAYLKDFKIVPKQKLPSGTEFGITFTTYDFNCPFFLSNFKKYFESLGVTFIRKELSHIAQAYKSDTKVVFNCTGLGAFSISGVKDSNVYPTRGQVVVVKAPHIQENRMRWGADYATYIIPRPYSNNELVLGGFLQKDNWTGDTFELETDDIIKRTTELFPEILDLPLEIIRVAAGLRPSRHGGPRIELERIEDKLLVHNYGASGYGYQAGLGMSHKAVSLYVKEKRSGKL